ncbi:MAG: tRNA lysidine(34) synthetase TilS [Cyanobacteria bacterium P01_A01_bin.45]
MVFSDSSWTSLHSKLHCTIRQRQLFERNQSLLIAVSGGQDSLCLIKLLLDLQSKWGWHVGIAHCDHRWRIDSKANAHHVERLAANWGIDFYLETATEAINSEAQARDWRYQALNNIAQKHHYSCIITGHTASDRAETLLYNLIRGTGADGLQALTWKRSLNVGNPQNHQKRILLVRPLLEITRTQTGKFCQDFQLPVWEDETNQNLKYARNRIRQELLPYLQQNFNPRVESALAQTAELLQAEVEFLEQTAQNLWEQIINEDVLASQGSNEELNQQLSLPLYIKRQLLQKTPIAIQRRVMRKVLQKVMLTPPNFEHIEKLTALIAAPNRTQTDPFPGGAIAVVKDNLICLEIFQK